MARGKFRKENTKNLGDIVLDEKTAAIAERKIAEAEAQLSKEVRVNFRWGADQLKLVQSVAEAMGVPYQTYIKQVLYRQALCDLQTRKQIISAT